MSDKSLPPVDAGQRYSIPESLRYLRCSRKTLYKIIAAGDVQTIAVGQRRSKRGALLAGRRYVPGSEIVRLSQAPT